MTRIILLLAACACAFCDTHSSPVFMRYGESGYNLKVYEKYELPDPGDTPAVPGKFFTPPTFVPAEGAVFCWDDHPGMPKLIESLRDIGYDDDALRKVTHENWVRVLRQIWR